MDTLGPSEAQDSSFEPLLLAPSFQSTMNGSDPASGLEIREGSTLTKSTSQLHISSTPSDHDGQDKSSEETNIFESDDELTAMVTPRPSLPYSSLPSGVCYDSRMRFHTELDPSKERSEYHPEDPRRIFWIFRTLCEAGLVHNKELSIEPLVEQPLVLLPARPATKDEVLLVHTERHFEFIKATASQTDDELIRVEKHYDSVYFNQSTFTAALLSAGSAIDTCLSVAQGDKIKNAIAVIRPPGHHACTDTAMGFCHFDNVAIAAKVVREKHPDIRKVLILDWDVHHGNGIQQAFESDPNVLYISIHVHQDGKFYPSGKYGDHLHCGIGAGIGKNVNIPWPAKGMGDADYLFAFQHAVMPIAFDFNPDYVIIAAGFDAAAGDQLGGCFVTPACYAHMTHMLMSLAGGKLVACLEGGYNLKSISLSALAVTKTLMGEPPPQIPETAATKLGVETVRKVIVHQAKYWRCLEPKDLGHDLDGIPGSENMHDVIRRYQSNTLHENHKMIPLWVLRKNISKSFDKQVLATPKYVNKQPLLLIFHDPPEVVSQNVNPNGRLELHQISLADVLNFYISWAVKQGFNIIDVNIPKFLTGISDPLGEEEQEAQKIQSATEELAIYLWENYVECNDSQRVVFFGVGKAYDAVLHILNTRTWEQMRQYAGTVGFLASTKINPVSDMFITDLGKRFYKSSIIFASRSHSFWPLFADRKIPKRYGKVHRSGGRTLNSMMWTHRDKVKEFLLEHAGLPKQDQTQIVVSSSSKVEEDGDTIMVQASVGQ